MKDNFGYLFTAYTFIWVLLAVYLGILMGKQRSIRRRIDELSEKLENLPKN